MFRDSNPWRILRHADLSRKSKRNLVLLAALIVIAPGIILFSVFAFQDNHAPARVPPQPNNPVAQDCSIVEETRTVRGSSLVPLVQDGQALKILFGYYACHEVSRGDLVIYRYGGRQEPIIKIVKGVEGDDFLLEKEEGGLGWNMLINNTIVKNSQGSPYIVSDKGYKILSLYIRDYKGVIPQNGYLILGDLPNGSLDSTTFGFIDKSDILGKVVTK